MSLRLIEQTGSSQGPGEESITGGESGQDDQRSSGTGEEQSAAPSQGKHAVESHGDSDTGADSRPRDTALRHPLCSE